MHIDQPFSFQTRAQNRIPENRTSKIWDPIRLVRDRIHGYRSKVARIYEILKGVRRFLLVQNVVIDCVAHGSQIHPENRLKNTPIHSRFVTPCGKDEEDKETKGDERDAC